MYCELSFNHYRRSPLVQGGHADTRGDSTNLEDDELKPADTACSIYGDGSFVPTFTIFSFGTQSLT